MTTTPKLLNDRDAYKVSVTMHLREFVLEKLAEIVIGDNTTFPYRSSYYITQFFTRLGFSFEHDGTTRKWWVKDRLVELNRGPGPSPDLPSSDILKVVGALFDPDDFDRADKPMDVALVELNALLAKQNLTATLDEHGHCLIHNNRVGTTSSTFTQQPTQPLSPRELEQRARVVAFLDTASEDGFTERLLVPLFQRLGFYRVTSLGHQEKSFEYGKDLWMKYLLPTGHWIYFVAQIKRDKLDAQGGSANKNTATVLNQIRMALDHPIFDPDINRKVLADHIFVVSAAEITRAARHWLVESLDISQRRQIIFMDRDEFLDHSARILLDLPSQQPPVQINESAVPF